MKILFDPIYTAIPAKCASNAKFVKLAQHLLTKYPDVFIYWPIPTGLEPAEKLAYPADERIMYIEMPYDRDRYREYRRIHYPLEKLISYYGEFWDWDLLITNRTTLVPLYRMLAHHHSGKKELWAKRILILEDFPQMEFKSAAVISPDPAQDRMVIEGYLAANATAISAYWEKRLIVDKARASFAPSAIRYLQESIAEATPVVVEHTELKTSEFIADQSLPFTIGFAGRMVAGHKFDKIFDIMEKNWVLRHDRKVECVISTQSAGLGKGVLKIPDFVELVYANREKFHGLMKHRVHVGLFFSAEEDYSMSLIEPLILGVPYAVYQAPWSEASLGPDYPFFFKSKLEAATIVKGFYDDYAQMYQLFAEWSKAKFEPLLRSRNQVSIFTEVDLQVDQWRMGMANYVITAGSNQVVQLIAQELEGANDNLTFEEALRRAESKGKVRHLADKIEEDQFKFMSTFSQDRHGMRLKLMALYNAQDKSVRPGSMAIGEGA